jgi:tRNA/rRNA methyltransferase
VPVSSEFDNLCVVLVSTRNPLNIGAAARAMSNLGFLRLRVVNPYEASFREARSAVGASPLLKSAEEYKSVAEAVADCALVVGTTAAARRQLQHPLRLLQEGAPVIRQQLRSARVALLFGSEKRGLSNHDLSHCQWLLRIPTRDEHRSMNLGQAVAVCLYELARDFEPASGKSPEAKHPRGAKRKHAPAGACAVTEPHPDKIAPAGSAELERLTLLLMQALRASGYAGPRSAASTEEKIRRMVRRLNLSAPDAEVLLGMLRQIVWKLGLFTSRSAASDPYRNEEP